MMKKLYLSVVLALASFAGLGITAKAAQVVDQIVLTVPFEFVVAGKTLPAGTYRVNRLWNDNLKALVISSYENNVSATVLATEVESAPVNKPQVTFETAGNEHFLSKIETADNLFTIPVSPAALLLASGQSHTGAALGNSGGTD
jgi:hypothetical protein